MILLGTVDGSEVHWLRQVGSIGFSAGFLNHQEHVTPRVFVFFLLGGVHTNKS